jgi:membrane protease YdiL (CAAX protease family)
VPYYFNWDAWLARFAVRSVFLRTAAFGACLLIAWRLGGLKRWGWNLGRPWQALALAALASGAFASLYFARESTAVFTPLQLAIGAASAIPVALFEEALFRGLIFLSLRPRLGAFGAAIAASAIFTLYHTAATNSWAMIFMFGFIACACLHAGLGLPWLMVLHAMVDAVWFPSGGDVRTPIVHPVLYWGACAVLYAGCMRGISLLRRKAALLP